MERIDKILDYISIKFEEKFLENEPQIKKKFLENKLDIKKDLFKKIENIISYKTELEEIYIIISPLKSSLITKKYELILGGYNDELYLDNSPIYEYFNIGYLFEYIIEDEKDMRAEISKMFTRLTEFELKEVMLKYEEKYMALYLEYIKELLKEFEVNPCNNKIIFLYGEFMEKSSIIFEIKAKEKV